MVFLVFKRFRLIGGVGMNKKLIASLIVGAFAGSASAATTIDMVAAIDESGSMSSWQSFVGTYVSNLDTVLQSQGITTNQYGLMGFGNSPGYAIGANEAGRETGDWTLYRHFNLVTPTSGVFGSAAQFGAVTPQLGLNGGTEDGYRAIDYILRNYQFRPNAGASILLVTDEDRDNDTPNGLPESSALPSDGVAARTYITSQLQQQNIVVNAVVDQPMTDIHGNAAIAVVGTPTTGFAYVKQEDGSVLKVSGGYVLGNTRDTVTADYSTLALDSGGTVMNIQQINSVIQAGGQALTNLTGELANLVAQISQNQQPVIGIICNGATGAALQICNALNASGTPGNQSLANQIQQTSALGPAQQQRLQQQVTPQVVPVVAQQVVQSVRQGFRQISQRLGEVRKSGGQGKRSDISLPSFAANNFSVDANQLMRYNEGRGGAASADSDLGAGFFLRGNYVSGNQDSGATSGFRSNTYNLMAGMDKYVSKELQVGVALGYSNSKSDTKNDGGDADSDTYSLSVYGSYELMPEVFVEGVAGYARSDIKSSRHVVLGGGTQVHNGRTSADQWFASLGVTKSYALTETLVAKPFARLNYAYLDLHGFTEKTGALPLKVKGQSSNSTSSEVGATFDLDLGNGWTSGASVSWEHQFNRPKGSTFYSTLDPVNPLKSQPQDWSRDYGRVGLSIAKQIGQNRNILFRADTMVGNNHYRENTYELKFRQEF
jgi:outer membrane autotransporter protein